MEHLNMLIMTSSRSVREKVLELTPQYPGVALHTRICTAEAAAFYLKTDKTDFDVILAETEIAQAITSLSPVPVIEIRISLADVLRSVLSAHKYRGKFAIVGEQALCENAQMICDLLQLRFDIFTVGKEDSLLQRLEALKQEGYGMILGESATAAMAQNAGLSGLPIPIGEAGIISALEQARTAAQILQAQNQKLSILQKALSELEFLIVILDEQGTLRYSSSTDPEFAPAFDVLKKAQADSGPSKFMVKLGSYHWSFEKHHLNTDQYGSAVCYYIQKHPYDLEDIATRGITIATHSDLSKHEISEGYLDSSSSLHKTAAEARSFAQHSFPVLILGEPGVGKNIFANIIHSHSRYRENHVVVVDCNVVEVPTWAKLLHDPASIFMESEVVFYFKNTELVPPQIQDGLISYLRSMHNRGRNKFVFSCNSETNTLPSQPLLSYIKKELQASSLWVAPLRERTGEFESLSSLYIHTLSVELHAQVIGLEPDAVLLLQEYSWPGNLNQFRRFMAELIVSTQGYYISPETVAEGLRRERSGIVRETPPQINLHGDLDDITRQVILQVLREESQNQTKAAQRLNISRSTLWRKLKN